jgi:hypothetical protein
MDIRSAELAAERDVELNRNLKRVKARMLARSKQCRVFDKAVAARQVLAAGVHPQFRRVEAQVEPDLDLEDNDFDVEEESDRSVYPAEEEFDYRDLHFCPMTQLYYEDYMRQRNEWFDQYFEELYAQRELEQAEKDYFIESCWDAILVNCH